MPTRFLRSLVPAVLVSATHLLAAADVPSTAGGAGDLWILSGQSNACGRGLPPGLPANDAVEVFDPNRGTWGLAVDPLPGMETKGVGPWQAAAIEYASLTQRQVRLAGAARGNRKIELWSPSDGVMWQKLSGVLERAGNNAGVFLWYQGEANCEKGQEQYQANWTELVARVRQGCANPAMTVVVVQLGVCHPGRALGQEPPALKPLTSGSENQVMRMRETQRQCVLSDPAALLVTAMGRKTQDYWHLSSEGQIELGREIGRALAARLHKVDTGWPGPVLDAAVLSEDRKTVTAHFAEVKQLSGITAADFAIVRAGGPSAEILAQATKAEAFGGTRIRLTFDQTVTLPAALVYGAGNAPAATLVDETGNRAPAVQLDLASGTLPDDKSTAAPNGAGIIRTAARTGAGTTKP